MHGHCNFHEGMHRATRTFCTIEMCVAQFDRKLHRIDDSLVDLALLASLVPSGSGTISEHGNGIAVIELQLRNGEVESCHC
jgi:hypothetical protein